VNDALLNTSVRVASTQINGETRWFITIGRPGFNLPANNRLGYATEAAAMAASLKCESKNGGRA
jgi:hypothetical protein